MTGPTDEGSSRVVLTAALLTLLCLAALSTEVGALEDIIPPHADAGEDQTVRQGQPVYLSGYNSTDNEGIRYWRWTLRYLGDEYSVPAPNMEFTFDEIGTYTVTLNVTDAAGNWDLDTVRVTVLDGHAPVARVSMPFEFDQFSPVSLDGSKSEDNVAVTNWTWTVVHDLGTAVLYGKVVSYEFPYAGYYTVNLTVRDAQGFEGNASVTAMARDFEKPVVVVPDVLRTTAGNDTVLDGSACRDNVGVVYWKWTVQYDKVEHDLEGETVTFRFEKAGQWQVTLYVKDAAGNGASASFTVIAEAREEDDGGGIPAAGGHVAIIVLFSVVLISRLVCRFHLN